MSAAEVLREYGRAVRGDWADIDGRTVLSDLALVAQWIEEPAAFPGIVIARRELGICVSGGGHWCGTWYGYCNSECGCPDDGVPR